MSLSFPVAPAIGQKFQQFTWDGSKWVAGAAAATAGNLVLINSTVVASAVASVDVFADFSPYDWLEIRGQDVLLTAEAQLMLRMSFDGSTFDAATTNHVSTSASAYGTNTGALSGAATAGFTCVFTAPAVATSPAMLEGKLRLGVLGGATPTYLGMSVGRYSAAAFGATHWDTYFGTFTTNTIKGLRFIPGVAANITRGTFKIFGVVK